MNLLEVDIPEQEERNVIRRNLKAAFKANVLIISFGIFSYAFSQKFGLSDNIVEIFGSAVFDNQGFSENLKQIGASRGHEVMLFVLTFMWYWVYREGAYNEVDLLGSLHSEARLPARFESFGRFEVVLLLAIGLTVCFIGMAIFVNYFPLFIIFMLLAYTQDMYGNRSIILQLRNLQQKNNTDIAEDPDFAKVRDIREVCYDYWLRMPQLERISGFFLLNVISLLIYTFVSAAAFSRTGPMPETEAGDNGLWFFSRFRNPELDHYDLWIVTSYLITMASIVANEHIMRGWRRQRNIQLREVRHKAYTKSETAPDE